MASKGGGARASGTDGTDFAYRQRVDAKYQKAALTRKNLKKVLLGMCAYYPAMLAFALAPAIVVGHGVDQHNGPFAAGACGGMVLTVATYSHVSGKKLSGGWLRGVTRVLAMLGFINLAAGLAARALLQEDKRMAWLAAELAVRLMPAGNLPGHIYPLTVSLELLLEIVGVVLPTAVVALAHALVMYTSPATAAKSK